MALKKEQIAKLSKLILDRLTKNQLAVVKVEESQVLERIERVFVEDFRVEAELNQDAEKLLQQYRGQNIAMSLNERELFLKIKKQLAKERNIVL